MGAAAGVQSVPRAPATAEQLHAVRTLWPIGALCTVSGLQSPAGQPLNGHLAEVRGLDDATGRLCLRLNPKHPPARWKKVRPEHAGPSRVPLSEPGAECSFCLERGDDEALVSPCLCRGSTGNFHLRCLQDAYEAKTKAIVEFPACPTCKHRYEGSLALMLLELKREELEGQLKPGMQVMIVGLAAAQFNGLTAELLEHDVGAARWKIKLGGGDVKAMRAENLIQQHSELHRHLRINFMRALGVAYSSANEPGNAASVLEKTLRIEEQLFQDQEAELSVTLTNLGVAYNQLKEGAKASEVLQRALAIREKLLGPDALDLLAILSNLGAAKLQTGDAKGSAETLERALDLGQRDLGHRPAELVPTLMHMASARCTLGEHRRAVELMERALSLQEKQYGEGHVNLVGTLVEYGSTCGKMGDRDKHIQAYERACTIAEKAGSQSIMIVIKLLMELRTLYDASGQETKAKACASRAQTLLDRSLRSCTL